MSAYENESAEGPGGVDGRRGKVVEDMVMMAVEKRHVAAVEAFIKSLRSGERPYTGELEKQCMELVEHLKRAGADLERALEDAATAGNIETARLLIKAGADVNKGDINGKTMLYRACNAEAIDTVTLLVEQLHADINEANNRGRTPLYVSSYKGHVGVVDFLIKHYADINHASHFGATSISISCQCGYLEVVRCLAEAGADVTKATTIGWTPLHRAVMRNHTEIARCLIAFGADTTLLDDDGRTALDYGHPASYRKKIKKLISDLWHDSPIHNACHGNDLEALRKLVQQKNIEEMINATAAVPGRGSWTALHVSSFMNRLEAAEILLANGADLRLVTSDNGGLTALHLACSRGHSDMVSLLLRALKARNVAAATATSSGGGAAIERNNKKGRAC